MFVLSNGILMLIPMESYNKASSTVYCVPVCRSQADVVSSLVIPIKYICPMSPFHKNSTSPLINFVDMVSGMPE